MRGQKGLVILQDELVQAGYLVLVIAVRAECLVDLRKLTESLLKKVHKEKRKEKIDVSF